MYNGQNNFIIEVELGNSSDAIPSVINMTEEAMGLTLFCVRWKAIVNKVAETQFSS